MFQACTLEGWSALMYQYEDSGQLHEVSITYFCVLIMVGAFFTLNLILAQIMESYSRQNEKFKAEKRLEREIEG